MRENFFLPGGLLLLCFRPKPERETRVRNKFGFSAGRSGGASRSAGGAVHERASVSCFVEVRHVAFSIQPVLSAALVDCRIFISLSVMTELVWAGSITLRVRRGNWLNICTFDAYSRIRTLPVDPVCPPYHAGLYGRHPHALSSDGGRDAETPVPYLSPM